MTKRTPEEALRCLETAMELYGKRNILEIVACAFIAITDGPSLKKLRDIANEEEELLKQEVEGVSTHD